MSGIGLTFISVFTRLLIVQVMSIMMAMSVYQVASLEIGMIANTK